MTVRHQPNPTLSRHDTYTQTENTDCMCNTVFFFFFSKNPPLSHFPSPFHWNFFVCFRYNNNSSKQLCMQLFSTNSKNIGGKEGLPQKPLTGLLKCVSLLQGLYPPHYWIILSCLPFSAHKRTKTAQSKKEKRCIIWAEQQEPRQCHVCVLVARR